ncbi:hypothetical protein [Mycobacteroides abscessus]|uniref:hypothetical protein n=1 Tax=Mycobacteroides abscessus TaxID=36809 RepID=UPI000E6809FF|nr:hypothetical protein [Mycobacteroides abscessus]RIU38556.1 hypothetical protein D2E83_16205 [Mycobacteroides abscessus]
MNHHLRILAAVAAALFIAACQPPSRVDEPTPVATTTVTDTQGVIPRFTAEIWPAINAYNSDVSQGSPGYQQWTGIITPKLDADRYGQLRSATQKLGTVREADQTNGSIVHDGKGLSLADTSLTTLESSKATLQVCYTYTADTRRTINDPPAPKPFASEATVELSKPVDPRAPDSWYLYAITDDHVVQGCSGSPKA